MKRMARGFFIRGASRLADDDHETSLRRDLSGQPSVVKVKELLERPRPPQIYIFHKLPPSGEAPQQEEEYSAPTLNLQYRICR